jgi:hypothetical protein
MPAQNRVGSRMRRAATITIAHAEAGLPAP